MSRPRSLADGDAGLVRRMAEGDEAALSALYACYGRRLFAYAYRVTGSRPAAEEVLQDSLLGAWRSARSFRGQARVITWLLGIVHRQALNAIRRKRLPTATLEEAEDTAGAEAQDGGAVERRQALSVALARLPGEQRLALELVFYQELGLAEAAEVCGCPIGTIKSRLSYAKAHLRAAFEREGLGAEDLL